MNDRLFWDSIFQQDIDSVVKTLRTESELDLSRIHPEFNTTPLICAIDSDSVEMVELLLRHGANPNVVGNGMSHALNHTMELAIEADDYEPGDYKEQLLILKLLIEYGADVNLKNYTGETAYEYAKERFLPAKSIFDDLLNSPYKLPVNLQEVQAYISLFYERILLFNRLLIAEYHLTEEPTYANAGRLFPRKGELTFDNRVFGYQYHGKGCTIFDNAIWVNYNTDILHENEITFTRHDIANFIEKLVQKKLSQESADLEACFLELVKKDVLLKRNEWLEFSIPKSYYL